MSKEEVSSVKSGLTWRSILALLYISIVFQPAVLYLNLVSGAGFYMAGAIQWATIILFVELTRLSGSPLTKQEATIIFLGAFLGWSVTWQINFVYSVYYKYSPVAKSFGIAEKIPYFAAPEDPTPWIERTFFHPSWIPIFSIFVVSFICGWAISLSTGLINRQIYIVEEKLPFPLAHPGAQMVIALTQRRPERLRIIAFSAIVGAFYAFLLYGGPYVLAALGTPMQFLPVPFADFNSLLHQAIPGASLGVATDAVVFTSGFVIPFPVCVGILVGSLITQFFGNYLLVVNKITEFGETWFPGLNIAMTFQRSFLYAWVSPIIGAALAAGVVPILRRPRFLIGAMKSLTRGRLSIVFLPYILAFIGYTVLGHYLAPDFPLAVLILYNAIWPFFINLAADRAAGVAQYFQIPYVRELTIIGSGYTGINGWFIPMYNWAGGWCQNFKICQLTETDHMSLVKAILLTLPVSIIAGFLYIADFWRIAPIPSGVYPWTQIQWPINATFQSIFITHPPEIFRIAWMIGGFIITGIAYVALDFVNLGPAVIGVASGLASMIPFAITTFVGAVAGQILKLVLGKEWWDRSKYLLAGGISVGEGIVVILATSIVLILKSMWILPF